MFLQNNLKTKSAADAGSHGSAHHIMPLKMYFSVFGALLVLTVATIGVSHLALPEPWAIIVAMIVALMKATLVAAFFMHLKYEEQFFTFILVGSLLFMGLFFFFTFSDFMTVGQLVDDQGQFVKQENEKAAQPASPATPAAPKN